MKIQFSKGFYYEKNYYWQCVLIPTITLLHGIYDEEHRTHTVLNLEWLFWNVGITFFNYNRNENNN